MDAAHQLIDWRRVSLQGRTSALFPLLAFLPAVLGLSPLKALEVCHVMSSRRGSRELMFAGEETAGLVGWVISHLGTLSIRDRIHSVATWCFSLTPLEL